ncbi:UNVERIFIED_ORG: hypothetical protein BTE55_11480 [Rhizobium sophorae]|uniref:hypothetical protein n=1 Tax=Rhizobium sophoriradicis TaxID=1535245 RepID=UPI00019065BA|nr:hypothetical protein Kim5_CH03918 [Rhizobium sp. Kim5]
MNSWGTGVRHGVKAAIQAENTPNYVAAPCEYLTFQRTAVRRRRQRWEISRPAAAALVSAVLALPAFAAPETLPGTAGVITLSGKRAKLVVATPLSPAAY